jgi:bifunctional non-homologous end joining protein LigD
VSPAAPSVETRVGERRLSLSNLNKVLWPGTGTTKGQLVEYYARIAPFMLPHLEGRAITLRRFPNGVDKASFFEKNCPSHRPDWLPTIEMGDVHYCSLGEPAALVWTANLAAIELHPTLAREPDLERPTAVVFDLDPGAPADVLTCAEVAFIVRELMAQLGLECWIKTSGSKGLQLYVPLNTGVTYERSRPFAQAVAQLLEHQHPNLIVSSQDKSIRGGKVLIDWSQNTSFKTTVAVYSVRARPEPTVSTPVSWEEVEEAAKTGEAERLRFDIGQVLARVDEHGDLLAPLLEVKQELPNLSAP